tara:strand:+ start:524 stop:1018 length:495 start_codon:yes stop_codon:yes gene_type:complete
MFSPESLSKILRLDWETDRIVKFNIHHLDICDLNEFDKKILTTFPDYKKHLENLTNNSLAFTAMSEGEIYGMFGIYQLWPGVSEGWLIPSAHVGRRTITFHRGALQFFEYAAQQTRTKRLQFTVCTSNVLADRWAKRCYFESEGILKQYGPDGSDYRMYARFFK